MVRAACAGGRISDQSDPERGTGPVDRLEPDVALDERRLPGEAALQLHASLAWRPPGGPADHALRSFTASLALAEALEALGVAGLSLKWPNDVLLHGGKLAGILLEAPEPGLLIMGIGVNLAVGPDGEIEPHALPPASLDGGIAPGTLLDTLAATFAAREAELIARGFAPIRRAWLDRAHGLGAPITARMMAETVRGTFADVDGSGHLVLDTATGRRALPAAAALLRRQRGSRPPPHGVAGRGGATASDRRVAAVAVAEAGGCGR